MINNSTYDAMKIVFSMPREYKEFLFNNWDPVIREINSELNSMEKTSGLKKQAKNHNPETSEEMNNLLELMEKFVSIDDNISYNNISVFINPMSLGSKKITIRPFRIVGLIRKLGRLSRKYEKILETDPKSKELKDIKSDFFSIIERIRDKLCQMDNEIVTKKVDKKNIGQKPLFSKDRSLERKIRMRVSSRLSKESQAYEEKSIEDVEGIYRIIENLDVAVALQMLENFNIDENDKEYLKRKIIEKKDVVF